MVILNLRFNAKSLQDQFCSWTVYPLKLYSFQFYLISAMIYILKNTIWDGMLMSKIVRNYSLTPDISVEFLSFYGLLNFYSYPLSFVHFPSKNVLYDRWYGTVSVQEIIDWYINWICVISQTPSWTIFLLSPCLITQMMRQYMGKHLFT